MILLCFSPRNMNCLGSRHFLCYARHQQTWYNDMKRFSWVAGCFYHGTLAASDGFLNKQTSEIVEFIQDTRRIHQSSFFIFTCIKTLSSSHFICFCLKISSIRLIYIYIYINAYVAKTENKLIYLCRYHGVYTSPFSAKCSAYRDSLAFKTDEHQLHLQSKKALSTKQRTLNMKKTQLLLFSIPCQGGTCPEIDLEMRFRKSTVRPNRCGFPRQFFVCWRWVRLDILVRWWMFPLNGSIYSKDIDSI